MQEHSYDYVVVGAGSAGCVLANRLTESGRFRVLLLEAGPRDKYVWIHIPIGYGKTMFDPVYNWGFYTEPEPGMHNRRIYWPRGRGLGGSSSINGLIYIRGQAEDYDHWGELGNRGWAWKDVLPYFIRSESNDRGVNAYHGADGPLSVSGIGAKHELVEAFIRGAGEIGIPRRDDFNDGGQEGAGYYQLTTRHGWRCSTAVGYLKPARGRRNLTIETGAHVTGVLLQGVRDVGTAAEVATAEVATAERVGAVGVTYERNGVRHEVRAAKEVLLCAGALQSPQLLQLSGIGPAALLGKHGIPVQVDLPGVGANLQDHLQLRLIYRCTKPITTNDDLRNLYRKMRVGLQWLLFKRGPLAIGINQGALFARALPDSKTPDVQFHFGTLSADLAGAKPHDFSGFTMSVCQLRPQSRGTVEIRSRDPKEAPAMRPNYLSTDLDRRTAVAGMRLVRRIAATSGMAPYVEAEYKPGPAVRSDDELLEFARESGATIFHPSGTCRMGRDRDAVLDDRLKVRGVARLRVIDGSIMPTLVSGNTNAPIIMIAEKASDMILQDTER
ncbi:MAG: GMC family oxidoreductase [Casimicrobiaceae bacterium]